MRPQLVSLWANYWTCPLAMSLCVSFHPQGSDKERCSVFSPHIHQLCHLLSELEEAVPVLSDPQDHEDSNSYKDQTSECA